MSDTNAGDRLQINTEIGGDLVNISAPDGETLKDKLIGFAENAEEIFEALVVVKQAGTAKAVFTGTAKGQSQAGPVNTFSDAPPTGDYASCVHGDRKFVDYIKKDGNRAVGWYCPAKYTGKGSTCDVIKLNKQGGAL